ncbi:hypothetical protein FPQ18DRAFT_403912 [Pyronema domesticum]|uniref:HMG box domain-containing protein n=1 Tax=Pyronema omphalodes (strain CBS 100304) TaxID=1076935 RepID=U4LTV7_PYROM|nr:hypothetical protein FPQ18DRAFT_403912 [Pyronema domesticum]CCX31126.1 Similar to conserved hypothetical protein [Pyrenophora tritici-repentis Pt-1C-BFP]; acc. no. XP_001931178 [Pyronema omphalodes CBS 100304]
MSSLARIITRASSVRVSVTPVTLQLRTAATKATAAAAGKPAPKAAAKTAATKPAAAQSKTTTAAKKKPTTKPKAEAVEAKAKKTVPTKKVAVKAEKAKKQSSEAELAKKAARKELLKTRAKEAKEKVKAKAKAASLRQREILKAQKIKARAIEKKKNYLEKALLDAPVKRTRKLSAFNVYLAEKMGGSLSSDGSAEQAQKVFIGHANAFKGLSESDVQKYADIATKKHIEDSRAYKAFIEKHTPAEIKEANAARRWLLKNKIKKGASVQPLVDDRVPSARPANMYAVFIQEQYKLNPGMKFQDAHTSLHDKWKSMTDAEKKIYRDQASANKLEYNAQLESLGLKATSA